MIDHLTVETLSAHLDRELAPEERNRVEEHLGACSDCRRELDGLRRTVERLRDLERLAPPEIIGSQIRRRVALETEGARPGRLRRRRFRIPVESSSLLTFSLVVALAAILYLFAGALEDRRTGTIPVDLGPRTESGSRAEVPSREWVWTGAEWRAEELAETVLGDVREVRRGTPSWVDLQTRHPELEALPESDRKILVGLDGGGRLLVVPASDGSGPDGS